MINITGIETLINIQLQTLLKYLSIDSANFNNVNVRVLVKEIYKETFAEHNKPIEIEKISLE